MSQVGDDEKIFSLVFCTHFHVLPCFKDIVDLAVDHSELFALTGSGEVRHLGFFTAAEAMAALFQQELPRVAAEVSDGRRM